MKSCVFYKAVKARTGERKTRCQYDGSIRNWCMDEGCPHFRPTLFRKIRQAMGKRREEKLRRRKVNTMKKMGW